jgi:hypothetical protein
MKYDVYKCDWCKEEVRVDKGQVPANGPWPERDGTIPVQKKDIVKNKKWMEPVKRKLIFCQSSCNQAHKEAEAEALLAANEAWLSVYNRKTP